VDTTRPQDPLSYERPFWGRGVSRIAGVDEVGRGPLAGPVVACALVLPADTWVEGADDSKRLTRARRETLTRRILDSGAEVGLGAASVREIETLNILGATCRAMQRALAALDRPPGHVVVDGLRVKGLGWEHEAVVGGDGLIHSISCASIVAKVVRDDLMCRLARRHPSYGWETNAGYGTRAHLEAIRRSGITAHHRRSFLGNQLSLGLSEGSD